MASLQFLNNKFIKIFNIFKDRNIKIKFNIILEIY